VHDIGERGSVHALCTCQSLHQPHPVAAIASVSARSICAPLVRRAGHASNGATAVNS